MTLTPPADSPNVADILDSMINQQSQHSEQFNLALVIYLAQLSGGYTTSVDTAWNDASLLLKLEKNEQLRKEQDDE